MMVADRIETGTGRFCAGLLAAFLAGTTALATPAAAQGVRFTDPAPPLVNDFGGVGLMQTPTARMSPEGQAYLGFSAAWPYRRYFVTLQALDWLEATLRYTDVRNVPYGPIDFSGDQTLKDRGIDVRVRLVEESATWPSLAVGLRDIAGTGVFQSEYLVANKMIGPVDVSLGLAWGNLGTRGHFRNPLGLIADRFDTRSGFEGLGGELGSDYFRGRDVAVFGGISWKTPIDGLTLLAEYDSNSYERELGGELDVDLPVNLGVGYQPWDWLQLGAALERGNRAMVRLAVTTNFNERSRVPKLDTPAPPMQERPANLPPPPARATTILSDTTTGADPAETAAGTIAADPASADLSAAIGRAAAAQAALDGLHLSRVDRTAEGYAVTLMGTGYRDWVVIAQAVAARVAAEVPTAAGRLSIDLVEDGQRRMQVALDLATPAPVMPATTPPEPVAEAPVQATASVPSGASGLVTRVLAGAEDDGGVAPDTVFSTEPGAPAPQVQAELQRLLGKQGTFLYAVDYEAPRVTLYVAQGRFRSTAKGLGRIARVAGAVLPFDYEEFRIVLLEGGMEMLSVSLMRKDMEGALTVDRGSVEELWHGATIGEPPLTMETAEYQNPAASNYPGFSWALRPGLRQTVGRPEAFVLYQLWARLHGNAQLTRRLSASGSLGVDIYNNFDKLRIPSDSVLPRVRSDIAEYLEQGTTALTHLQLDYAFPITTGWYGHFYGGLLEEMFGGVGGEVLYHPLGRDWAIGLDVAWAKQRDYDQWFKFRDYDVVTGHLTGYYHYAPLAIDARVKVGRYLAGDYGATFEFSRTFDSGITVGAFATFTDVSAEQFGEGSFDKGLYIVIPLDQLYVRSVRGAISWLWRPLTRDGGQTLVNRRPLVGTTYVRDLSSLRRDWDTITE
ncbi:MAG: hypothetical protein RLY86_3463 [Pseudomonadota bacterium]|jgi:hypothetical protein